MMKPFVSNHALFHPKPFIRELLERRGLKTLERSLSGLSLKYLRSQYPVYSFTPDAETFEETMRVLSDLEVDIGDNNVSIHSHSCKVILPEGYGDHAETHLLIHSPDSHHDIKISIDDLTYDWDNNRWDGPTLPDYEGGLLRLLNAEALSSSSALKLCALSAMLDFTPDETTLEAIRYAGQSADPRSIPRGFLRTQLQKIVTAARPSQGFIALSQTGLLDWFLPELAAGRGLMQNRFHRFDIFHHCIYSCDAVERNDLHLRLAGLLHDIGKVPTRRETTSGEATFHSHEVVGARIAGNILHRLGFNKDLIQRVKFLVRNHMFHYTAEWTDRTVRRFLTRVSREELTDLIDLRMADRKGSGKGAMLPPQIRKLLHHIEKIHQEQDELKIRDLKVGGDDLKALGILPGPMYGDVLKELLERVKKGELQNDRDQLLQAIAERIPGSTRSSTG